MSPKLTLFLYTLFFLDLIANLVFINLAALWALFLPDGPNLTVANASLTQFNFTAATNVLDYNLTLNFTVVNPNKRAVIECRTIQVIATYSGQEFANVTLTPFYQDPRNTTLLAAVIQGRQQMVGFSDVEVFKFNSDTADGVYSVNAEVRFWGRYNHVKVFKKIEMWPLRGCKLRVPLRSFSNASSDGFTADCHASHDRLRWWPFFINGFICLLTTLLWTC